MQLWTTIKGILLGILVTIAAFFVIKKTKKKELKTLIKHNKIKEKIVKEHIKNLEKDKKINKKEITKLKKELKVLNQEIKEMEKVYTTGDETEATEFLKDFLNS